MILVPAIMSLLDVRAWWMPRWLEPVVPPLRLEGSAPGAHAAVPAGGGGGGPGAPSPPNPARDPG